MIPEKDLEKVLQAGLLSPSGRSLRPWEFILVRDKETLRAMSECRAGAAKMLEGADAAIVVIADAEKQDVWTEDCSIAMSYMHLTASALGLGRLLDSGQAAGSGGRKEHGTVSERSFGISGALPSGGHSLSGSASGAERGVFY